MEERELNSQMESKGTENRISRQSFLKYFGSSVVAGGLAGAGSGFLLAANKDGKAKNNMAMVNESEVIPKITSKRVAAEPTKIPPPIHRTHAITKHVILETKEVISEIEPGVVFHYMTFGGQVPGPMIRVRQGDTIHFTLKNLSNNTTAHNIDLHAVYGTGGGNEATIVGPGESKSMIFKAMYPGAFIYHCAVPNMDMHISSGMFGMIVVEPPEGLAKVDHEFYFGQNEIYTNKPAGKRGLHNFSIRGMIAEDPTYVLLNGEKHAITKGKYGAARVKEGQTARIFFVNGGPNLTSSFHPIGNIWTKVWREGGLANRPEKFLQTVQVAPGSTGVFELEFPVPEIIKLVDHALTRVTTKGMLGEIQVSGNPQLAFFNPHP